MTSLTDIQRHVGVTPDGKLGPVTLAAIAKALGVTRQKHALASPSQFYATVRTLTGPLIQVQVNSIDAILTYAAEHPLSWVAYELATAWHEALFKPVPEIGRGKGKAYGLPGRHGQPQYGRGLVQLTWDANYEWADAALAAAGLIDKGDLLADFDLALRPDLAAFILVRGMEEGAFTKRDLAMTLPDRLGTFDQFARSRPIINGTDRASKIADHAMHFQFALEAGGWA